MHTINDVKTKLIDHLMSIDLSELSMMDLAGYTGIVCQVNGMDKADYMDTLTKLVASGYGSAKKDEEAKDNG